MKLFKKSSKRSKEDKRKEDAIGILEDRIAQASEALDEAHKKLSGMDPDYHVVLEWKTDKDGTRHPAKILNLYDQQVRAIDTLTKDLNALIERRDAVMYPKRNQENLEWWEKINWGDVLRSTEVILGCAIQSAMIFKLQRDGHLIGRDAAKIQMPKAY
jgi:hypothetical protein